MCAMLILDTEFYFNYFLFFFSWQYFFNMVIIINRNHFRITILGSGKNSNYWAM